MDIDQTTLEVEWVPRDHLHPNPANPRRNDDAVPHVAASLQRFGWRQPIVAREDGEVVAGHTRLLAAAQLGMPTVPVVRFEGTAVDAAAYGIADNRSHEHSEWDEDALREVLAALQEEDALEGVGFTDEEIGVLLAAGNEPEPEELPTDEVPDPPEEPISAVGDLWLLGDHRVLCGDCRRAEDLDRLLDGARADLVWTDPPYGVAYVGGTKDELTIQNDTLEGDALEQFLRTAFERTIAASKPGAVWYVAAPAGPNFLPFAMVLADLGVWRQTLVWAKDAFVLGRSDYHYRHEALFYGWSPGASHREPPDRTHDTVWEFDRPRSSPEHPTMKPVALVAQAIKLSSGPGELVLDPFLGSGTTLLAAQGTGRRCAGLEVDPRYVDVIVRRWQEATGQHATLESSNQPFEEVARDREARVAAS